MRSKNKLKDSWYIYLFNPNKFLFTLTQALFAIFWRLDENMWATTVMSEMFMTVMQFNFAGKPSILH